MNNVNVNADLSVIVMTRKVGSKSGVRGSSALEYRE